MTHSRSQMFTVAESQTATILTMLRRWLPGQSWSAVRKLLQSRRVTVNGVLCLDEGRRLSCGETVTIVERALPPPPGRHIGAAGMRGLQRIVRSVIFGTAGKRARAEDLLQVKTIAHRRHVVTIAVPFCSRCPRWIHGRHGRRGSRSGQEPPPSRGPVPAVPWGSQPGSP